MKPDETTQLKQRIATLTAGRLNQLRLLYSPQQHVNRPRSSIHRPRRAKRQHFIPLAQPVIHLLLQNRPPVAGTFALAMDNAHTMTVITAGLMEESRERLLGRCDGHSMQIQRRADLEVTTPQFA
jgi:hypothetical protein